ncbi:MAG: hypothetical protein JNK16_09595 [Phycisphaerales bacterium]|nr:hypothetical protein [Phycisphaerales bacterium]
MPDAKGEENGEVASGEGASQRWAGCRVSWGEIGLEGDQSSRGGEDARRLLSERKDFSALPNDSPESRTMEEVIFDRGGILELSTMHGHSLRDV